MNEGKDEQGAEAAIPESAEGLAAGEYGWWPVIGAVVMDTKVGDRITVDGEQFVVKVCVTDGIWFKFTAESGRRLTIGIGYHLVSGQFALDRLGTHAELGRYVR